MYKMGKWQIFKTRRDFKNGGNLQNGYKMDNHRITGLNDPQNSTDVVNKQFVENQLSHNVKTDWTLQQWLAY